MDYQNSNNRPQRQMFDISDLKIVCAECNSNIAELPFRPTEKEDGTYGKLYCYQCNKKRMENRRQRGGFDRSNRY
jgi:hypothetical protein